MPKLAALLLTILCVAFLAALCVTAAFWAGTAPSSEASAQIVTDSQSSHLTKTSVARQNENLEPTFRATTTSGRRVLALQLAATNNATQPSNLLTVNNITRIIVPISTTKNASNGGAQNNNGFTLPAWLWIWAPILILVIILTFLLVRLVRNGHGEPPDSTTRRVVAKKYPSETGTARPRQIPIEGTETAAGLTDKSRSRAKDQKVRIPIDADEPREAEEES